MPRSNAAKLAVDLLIGALAAACAALARIAIEQVAGGVAPFILTFPVVMIATLVAGGRAGTVAAVCCQLLTIRYVFPNWVSVHGGISTDLANIVVSTVALAGTIWATASYRRTAALVRSQCETRVHRLSLLLTEMDHRTKNNFQIAAGLLAHQSIANPALAHEFDKAALRLETIASVYQDLSTNGTASQTVDLAGHIGRIVALLRTGAVPETVRITCRADHVDVPIDSAIIIGLIVNEWVTNALKHAFDAKAGHIDVGITSTANYIDITVFDDGTAHRTPADAGRGSDLMRWLSDIIGASIAIDRKDGTRCTLTLPKSRARHIRNSSGKSGTARVA